MSTVTFFHAPQSRSTGVLLLLEELGRPPVELRLLDIRKGDQLKSELLAINPMGKVPTLLDGGSVVTEQVAVYQYLAERFPQAGLVPAVGDALRGPFLRWLAFYGSSYEPALIDRYMKSPAVPRATSPYGDFDTMYQALLGQLSRGPWMLGERFSAADVLWGSALEWTMGFGMLPRHAVFDDYVARFNARPAIAAGKAWEARLVTELAARQG